MSWMAGSPTTNRRADPAVTATFTPSVTRLPPGVTTRPTTAIVSCIATAQLAPRQPSSPSSQHVTASPLKYTTEPP